MKSRVSAKKTAEKQKRFIESYHKYSSIVMKVAFDKTSDFNISEEICQNVFLSYFVNMDKILPRCDKAWLILTTKNLTIDYLKKASTKYEALHKNPLQEKYSVKDGYDTVKEMMKEKVEKELSGEILRDLKRRNRSWYRIMYGVYIEGRSAEDVARSLGISTSKLYSKIYRAKNYIKDRYGEQYMEYFKYFYMP
ncbi:MAG: sigma-70 family RNA polymerase sigma factor [Eubacteriales bacterium]|nr:sigma-70 family RNA polymerase sigma factor [Eubacteriales bacterium]